MIRATFRIIIENIVLSNSPEKSAEIWWLHQGSPTGLPLISYKVTPYLHDDKMVP